jgi:exonuclease SbcD
MACKLTFVHTADIHMDVPFALRHADELMLERRRMERKALFQRIIDRTLEEDADLLLIAGDLFEHAHVRRSTVQFIIEQLNRLTHTKVFISPGNHDPLLPTSYYRTLAWPPHIHIFQNEWESVVLDELNVVIHGWGFDRYEVDEPLLRTLSIDDRTEGRRYLALIHGTVVEAVFGEHSPYLPITLQDIERSGVSYLALGHIHKQQFFYDSHGSCIGGYPGTPEGSRFSEEGEKGIVIGEWTDRIKTRFVPMKGREYVQFEASIDGSETEEQLLGRIKARLEAEGSESSHFQHMYRVRCTGMIHPELRIHSTWIMKELEKAGYDYVEISDESFPDYDLEALSEQPDVVGDYVREMLYRLEEAQGDERRARLIRKAIQYGLDALLAGSVERR